jgi:hypothetical protein
MQKLLFCVLVSIVSLGFTVKAQPEVNRIDTISRRTLQPPDPIYTSGTRPSLNQSPEINSVDPLIRIQTDAVPLRLQRVLSGSDYSGWEKSPILVNKKTNVYYIGIRKGDSVVTYQFNRFGRRIELNNRNQRQR